MRLNERRKRPGCTQHQAVALVIWFVGITMLIAIIGGLSGMFMKSANEHFKDMVTAAFEYAKMALTGMLGLLAKTGLDTATGSTQTGDVNVGDPAKVEPAKSEGDA